MKYYDRNERYPINRKELFDIVWKKRLSRLAAEWECNESKILRVCHKYNILTPDDFEKQTHKPDLTGDPNQAVSFESTGLPMGIIPSKDKATATKMNFNSIKVPEKVKKFHPLTADINLIDRSNRIADTLMKSIEKIGGNIESYDSSHMNINKRIHTDINGCKNTLWIWEPAKRIKNNKKRNSFDSDTILTLRGLLSIKIEQGWDTGLQQNFTDRSLSKIENDIPFILTFLFWESLEHGRRLIEEKWLNLEKEKIKLLQEELEKQEENRRKFQKNFTKSYITWKKVNEMRLFINDLKANAIKNPKRLNSIKKFNEYIKEAKQYVESIDPFESIFCNEQES